MACFFRPDPSRALFGGLIAVMFAALVPAMAGPRPVELAPHRAIYDLKLKEARGNQPVEEVRGRILYDFSGNLCEGYALQFRQVSELDLGEDKQLTADLRATTWEDGAAKAFRFRSENYTNNDLSTAVDGNAERGAAGVSVVLTKPEQKKITLDAAVVFPTEHMRRIVEAALAGKTILEVPVFDGSDNGEKVYDTLTVIGQRIAPGEKTPDDVAGRTEILSKLARWPVNISYFDRGKKSGEQMPIYSIRFEMYENGISRALVLDYNDFSIGGEMTSLEITPSKPCR